MLRLINKETKKHRQNDNEMRRLALLGTKTELAYLLHRYGTPASRYDSVLTFDNFVIDEKKQYICDAAALALPPMGTDLTTILAEESLTPWGLFVHVGFRHCDGSIMVWGHLCCLHDEDIFRVSEALREACRDDGAADFMRKHNKKAM